MVTCKQRREVLGAAYFFILHQNYTQEVFALDYSDYIKPSKLNRQKRRDKRLHEEIIECGRYNGGDRNKKYRETGLKKRAQHQVRTGDMPFRESICQGSHRTWFDDNLEPLTRFLERNAGRKWDDVYSELAQRLDKKTVTGLHVYEHLWHWVDLHPLRPKPRYGGSWKMFVHPETGILHEYKNAKIKNGIIVMEKPDAKGDFPKKARWKKQKEKEKIKRKLGLMPPPPFNKYRKKQWKKELQENMLLSETLNCSDSSTSNIKEPASEVSKTSWIG